MTIALLILGLAQGAGSMLLKLAIETSCYGIILPGHLEIKPGYCTRHGQEMSSPVTAAHLRRTLCGHLF